MSGENIGFSGEKAQTKGSETQISKEIAMGVLELGGQLARLYKKSQEKENPEKAPNAYLKDGPDIISPTDKEIVSVTREGFASPVLRNLILEASAAGISDVPVPAGDNFIYTVRYSDGSETMVVLRNEESLRNDGAKPEMIPTSAWVYQWDGRNHMIGTEPSGKVTDVEDDTWGNPTAVRKHWWSSPDTIGMPIGKVEFAEKKAS